MAADDTGRIAVDQEEAWAAVLRRDRGWDGRFVTGVLSTGIYCRPSCAARHPARANVRFFGDGAAARAAGLRACKRCLPDDCNREEKALDIAFAALTEGAPVSLAELSVLTGFSAAHFQRLFKRATGLSPSVWQRVQRIERARQALAEMGSVTRAVYEAGYESASRFYADMKEQLGMTPSAWAAGGKGVTIRWQIVATSVGPMLLAASDKGICRLSFGEGEVELRTHFPAANLIEGGETLRPLLDSALAAVENPCAMADLPLDIGGTAFRQAVWSALRRIPAGETRSYAELAADAGHPRAVRAAGSANGANPVAVLIPCHRVIRADGSLGGYAYGEAIKRELLRREREG